VLGGDALGFPNGRRPMDDTVEIELLAVAGAAYSVLDGRDTDFTFNPALINVLDDGIDANDVPFRSTFPYFAAAQSGQEHIHQNPGDANSNTVAAGLVNPTHSDRTAGGPGSPVAATGNSGTLSRLPTSLLSAALLTVVAVALFKAFQIRRQVA